MLDDKQQKLVEDSLHIVPKVITAFVKKYACLREVARCCDLESAAYLALCTAARTYDPTDLMLLHLPPTSTVPYITDYLGGTERDQHSGS